MISVYPIINGIEIADDHGNEWRFDVQICAVSNTPIGIDDLRQLEESPNEWITLPSGNKIRGCKLAKPPKA